MIHAPMSRRRLLLSALAASAVGLGPARGQGWTPVPVAAGNLARALAACRGGEVLALDGDQGDLSLRAPRWEAPVTLVGGRLGTVSLLGVPGLHFDGTVMGELRADTINRVISRDITFDRVEASAIFLADVAGFAIRDSRITGGTRFPLVLAGARDGEVRRSTISDWLEDAVRITRGARHIVIEDNVIRDPSPAIRPKAHSDMIQMFGRNGAGPSDITIRRNLMRAQPRPRTEDQHRTQGFLVNNHGGGGFRNVVIEENLIDAASVTVAVFDGMVEGCVFRRNTVLPLDRGPAIGQIRVVHSPGFVVEENIAPLIRDVTGNAKMRRNYTWRRTGSPFPPAVGSPLDFIPHAIRGPLADYGPDHDWIRSLAK